MVHQLVPDEENLRVEPSALQLRCHCLRTAALNLATGSVGHWSFARHGEPRTKDPSKWILWVWEEECGSCHYKQQGTEMKRTTLPVKCLICALGVRTLDLCSV